MGRCTHRVLGIRDSIIAICQEPLRFFGIRGEGEKVERWYVGACGFYTVYSEAGSIIRMTREEPRRGYFNHPHDLCKGRPACIAG